MQSSLRLTQLTADESRKSHLFHELCSKDLGYRVYHFGEKFFAVLRLLLPMVYIAARAIHHIATGINVKSYEWYSAAICVATFYFSMTFGCWLLPAMKRQREAFCWINREESIRFLSPRCLLYTYVTESGRTVYEDILVNAVDIDRETKRIVITGPVKVTEYNRRGKIKSVRGRKQTELFDYFTPNLIAALEGAMMNNEN